MSTTTPPPIILPEDLKFYLSGGYFNSDPSLSLGGETSSFQLVSGVLNGLFDRVDVSEAESGDTEYRCVYLRNTSQTRKLLGTKIWIETGTASPDTTLGISIGSAGINGTEPTIPEEGLEPPMNFFEIPLQAPEEPNIGDLYPGDHIALWIRWQVKTGTTSIGDDFGVLRIDGEREPESITTPLPPPTDPPDPPTTEGCPQGSKWSPVEMRCVDDSTVIICPNGYTYNSTTQRCVPPTTPPPSVPLFKFAAVGDTYTSSDTDDVFGLLQRQLNTTAGSQDISVLIHTGDTTHIDGNIQTFVDLCEEYLGGMFPNHIAPALGNHDDSEDGGSGDGQDVIDAFPMMGTNGYYAFTRRNIRFIVVNTQESYSSGSAQHTFITQQLQQAAADPTIKWKVLSYHKPSVVSACYYGPLTDFRNLYLPLFDQYKVDLIFSGHVHVYWRTKPIKFDASNPATPIIVSEQTTGNYINIDGRTFISDSTGGRDSHAEFSNSTAEAYIANRAEPPPYGAVFCTLQDNGNQMRVQWMSTGNQVTDDITLSKPGATPPPTGGQVCPQGFNWDETLGRCIISPTQCPTNYRWEPAQNKCVPSTGTPPPTGSDPLIGVEWFYDSTATQNTPQTINPGSYDATEGILLASSYADAPAVTIVNGWITLPGTTLSTATPNHGNSRLGVDYWKKSNFASDERVGRNTVIKFKFEYNNNISISITDGCEYPTGILSPARIFQGYFVSITGPNFPTVPTASDFIDGSGSLVTYWYNPTTDLFHQGSLTFSAFPGGRSLEVGNTYEVFATYRTNRVTNSVIVNCWVNFGDGTGWIKTMTDIVYSPSNWSPTSTPPAGYIDSEEVVSGPPTHAELRRHRMVIRNNNTGVEPPRPPVRVKDIKVGTTPYLDGTTNPPPPPPPGGGGGTGGTLDSNGIRWYMATGQQGVISQSRDTDADDRWSGNVTGATEYGFEATMYMEFNDVASGGHWAMKMWGGNHCGDCQYEEDGACCCWYDLGIRSNGDVQQEIERPHPSNDGFTKGQLMDNIGTGMDGNTIGLKWLIYPLIPGGNADEGGLKIKMWVDTAGYSSTGKPQNQWKLVMDLVDTGDILGDYVAPDEIEFECRNSDTGDQQDYAGGLHWRKIVAGNTDQSGGGGGTNPPPPPPPPGGGGTIPPGVAFKFNVAGDFRSGSDAEATAVNLVSDNPDVFFFVGDYAVGDATEEEWCNEIMAPVKNSGVPIWGCLGNHDNDDFLNVDFFENTGWSWMVKFGNIAFIGADTIEENVSQTQTLINTAQADATVNRIVIFMHESVFKQTGGGTSGSDASFAFHTAFKTSSKLKLVIAGHSHNYTRFAAYEGIVYVINEDGGQQPDENTGCMHCAADATGNITCRMISNGGSTLDTFVVGADGTLPGGGEFTLLPEGALPPVVVRIGPPEDYDAINNKKEKSE